MSLTEFLLASISTPPPSHTSSTAFPKDAGIFLHEVQPTPAQRHVYKKSTTPAHCLAVTRGHIFAAQEGKAVVHVYNREKGNQEATIAFGERISAIAIACGDSVLLLGTEKGSLICWEVGAFASLSNLSTHFLEYGDLGKCWQLFIQALSPMCTSMARWVAHISKELNRKIKLSISHFFHMGFLIA